MGIVGTGFSMSLDGFIARPNGDVGPLFAWYFGGDTEIVYPGGRVTISVSAPSAVVIRELIDTVGAVVVGRRHFDEASGWGGRHPANVPVFVVTHTIPEGWANDGAPFTFVTDGVASAIAQARAVAGEKNVGIGGANVAQQALRAGLVDEIAIELVPILLGAGRSFFGELGVEIALEHLRTIEAPGVTHLRYRVIT